MRNPKRIDEFCSQLAEYWHLVPDWRFGQLIYNVLTEELNGRDMFFLEENKMLECFEHFFEPYKEKMKNS